MKKRFLLLISLLLIIAIPFSKVGATNLNEYFDANDNLSVKEEINHSIFRAGNSVNVDSNVSGLSFLAGNEVKIVGSTDYGFLAGSEINVDGRVEKDLFAAGKKVSLSRSSVIGRDLYLAGEVVNIATNITGNSYLAADSIVLDNNSISGDLYVSCSKLIINGDVNINGTLHINEDVVIDNEDHLNVTKKEIYKSVDIEVDEKNIVKDIVLSILMTVFMAIILTLIFKDLFTKLSDDVEAKDVLKTCLLGICFLIAVPVVSLILLCTVVGMLFALLLILSYVISLMIATILGSTVVGHYIWTKLFKKEDNIYVNVLIGILVVKLFSYIPFVGGLVAFIVFTYGLGFIFNLVFKKNK